MKRIGSGFLVVLLSLVLITGTAWGAAGGKNYEDFSATNISVDNLTVNTSSGTKSFPLQLVAAALNGAGVIGNDGVTAPGLATTSVDLMPAIVYADSSEIASIGWTFMVPQDYSSGLSFRMLISSDVDTSYASAGIDWSILVNTPGAIFDAVDSAQALVWNTNPNISTSNGVLTLTPAADVLSVTDAGDIMTVWFWNGDARGGGGSGTTEIKVIDARYTAK